MRAWNSAPVRLASTLRTGDHWQSSAHGQETIHTFRYALYDGVSSGSEDGSPVGPLMGRFSEFDGGVTSIHLGGTSFLVCYPDHGMIYRFIPKSVDTCEMELIWLVTRRCRRGQGLRPRKADLALEGHDRRRQDDHRAYGARRPFALFRAGTDCADGI